MHSRTPITIDQNKYSSDFNLCDNFNAQVNFKQEKLRE